MALRHEVAVLPVRSLIPGRPTGRPRRIGASARGHCAGRAGSDPRQVGDRHSRALEHQSRCVTIAGLRPSLGVGLMVGVRVQHDRKPRAQHVTYGR
jgi:hypothetical protein